MNLPMISSGERSMMGTVAFPGSTVATITAAPQWFPTHMLRLALRKSSHGTAAVEVLQQWWHCRFHPDGKAGEWRDVPKSPDCHDQTPPPTVYACEWNF